MGLTTRLLRDWMRTKRNQKLAELTPPTATISMAELPAQGQRWRRNPDGSWTRWSYLGNEWEPHEAPEGLVEAASAKLAENEWTFTRAGTWEPVDHDEQTEAKEGPRAAEPSEHPAPLPVADPPRPEWTAEWKPQWGSELKPPD